MILSLDSPEIAKLTKETSIRGSIARLALQKAVSADTADKMLLDEALQELLRRFDGKESAQA